MKTSRTTAPTAEPAVGKEGTERAAATAACWHLYLLECRNGAYYAGITNRLESRYAAHAAGTGAKYTRANPPLRLLASREYPDRSTASRAEAELKRLPRAKKLAFFAAFPVGAT
ncbi:GIY-YIG nuclease family protein [Pseudoxanthomonas sp. SL93]|uniref:GIY-YIG nuclease family protein n=1 Tax=Pseudoxanthomonas sp. SL93 TaxID=2995142 RepID=UPI002270F8B8|nr:GIY-YIG nuclease family protein [Pseudoxanthomonas sp. SL93]WAC63815.1 GIY-YIG nuclease family protein [Pseudoxanthomonas sp. SL93]